MYRKLFRSETKDITILQEAQQATEEIYISSEEPVISIVERLVDGDNSEDGDHT